MTLTELTRYLAEQHADFELVAHAKPIRSIQDAAGQFDVARSAPVLIVETEKGLISLIVSALRGRLDFPALQKETGFVQFRLADRKTVTETTGYVPGALPLIGLTLPCLFDHRLLAFDFIYGGSGNVRHTLKIAPADVKRLNNVIGALP